ncbi:LysR family transcriptional regulator [Marinicellulosiphila megalodicopiae]|uniref:LysR family transcriptional regulator n=1 Tax=Marinicellulosiphila megalodicopiae TaxID=2724896 RepID=UPI003BAFB77A
MNFDLNELRLFIHVAKHCSITQAALASGEQKSKISRKIQSLESNLQTRLFYRKPGEMSLSESGKQLFELYAPIFEQLEQAQSHIINEQAELKGTIKILLPLNLSISEFTDVIFEFNKKHKDIRLHCSTVNVHPNVPQSDFDVMFLLDYMPLPDHFYIAKKIFEMEVGVFCNVDYFKTLPDVIDVEKIDDYDFVSSTGINGLNFVNKGTEEFKVVQSRIYVDGYLAQKRAALQGLGLFMCPRFLIEKELENKELKQVKFNLPMKSMNLYLAYKEQGYKTKPVQYFIDHVCHTFEK